MKLIDLLGRTQILFMAFMLSACTIHYRNLVATDENGDPLDGDGDGSGGAGDDDGSDTGGASPSTGGTSPSGSGGAPVSMPEYPDADFVTRGLGEVDHWRGYLFTVTSDDASVTPESFTGSNICVTGTVTDDLESFAMVGFNLAQEVEPVTLVAGEALPTLPGGQGIQIEVVNNTNSLLRIALNSDEAGTEQWCALAPASGSGMIPWGDFRKECWASGGAVYDPTQPITQVYVQVPSQGAPHNFDYCVVHLGYY